MYKIHLNKQVYFDLIVIPLIKKYISTFFYTLQCRYKINSENCWRYIPLFLLIGKRRNQFPVTEEKLLFQKVRKIKTPEFASKGKKGGIREKKRVLYTSLCTYTRIINHLLLYIKCVNHILNRKIRRKCVKTNLKMKQIKIRKVSEWFKRFFYYILYANTLSRFIPILLLCRFIYYVDKM